MGIYKTIKKVYASNAFFQVIVYICFLVSGALTSCVYLILRILPINKKKIVFCNMKGSRYGDNPMEISQALHRIRPDFEIVWLLNGNQNIEVPNYVKRAEHSYFNRAFELVTAKVWVDSNTKEFGVRKRKEQLYLQTWHGSYGIKKIGLDVDNSSGMIDKVLFPSNSRITDAMISNSKMTSEIYRRAFGFKNNMLEIGSPRNDVFFNENQNEIVNKVKEFFNIGNKKILLYAPTYRSTLSVDFFTIDLQGLEKVLEEVTKESWCILVRLHPQNISDAKNLKIGGNILNATEYTVMQDLLVASDCLITDYSSCMFDFITKPKPCFIYAPDLDEFENDRGNYWKINDLPFPVARNNKELFDNVREFDLDMYKENVVKLHEKVGLCETGKASELAVNYILDFIENGGKRK
ncbi:CDP-glycerol glycerophosphotransferase family protein [Butyrivibrio sp. YAB3001]|uniref:CDP-glycerol glycerophosphotransferase family protein n=1 Tax=Butyrivibrio sp. YAB3001 TaxID=1520812 RepID=UPI0008F62533|nr:CDP-glycerol glycerophosphotransferase family protein [Butyrivibrio sp. YAB3001]SFC26801.1 CDP-glycerol glycerophosphotransferase [Butyrivibrio sp. YAB3001]